MQTGTEFRGVIGILITDRACRKKSRDVAEPVHYRKKKKKKKEKNPPTSRVMFLLTVAVGFQSIYLLESFDFFFN